jgi:PAS domain S-box-containing protein
MSASAARCWRTARVGHRTAAEGHKVLVVAPFGRDAEAVVHLLRDQRYDAHACVDLDAAAAALDERVGVVLLTEEAMRLGSHALRAALAAQPSWSDIPFILLAARRRSERSGPEGMRARLLDLTGNAIVLERPLGSTSLLSATASAMRSRQRQFETRDRMHELEMSRAALAASEEELRRIADALPVLIAFVDRSGRYRFANRAYEEWFYVSPEDILGLHVREVLGEEAYRLRQTDIRRALAGEAVSMEVPTPRRDGRRRDTEIRYLPRRNARGEVDGFHVFGLDITDRKQTQELLAERVAERTAALQTEMENRARAEAALLQSQKMEAVGQLTGGIAHDFNNMLTGVIGAMDIMKRRIAAGRFNDLDRFMDAATTSAQRAAALTARLLAFSRRQSLDTRAVEIDRLIASLEQLLRRSIRENIELHIVPAADPLWAETDANQLENAILNLTINARDAMPEGGQLTIETRVVELDQAYVATRPDIEPGRYVVIAVSDTGVGMPPELLGKVFDPFFTTKPIGQGTGLGLSMVYGFARQSGGQVRIHSQPGDGTTVSVYLRAVDGPSGREDASTYAAVAEGSGQTVLLVEDDSSVRLLVREVLEELCYETLEAEEPNAAIAILSSDRHIDLMVSDVGLPGMNGRQLAEIARQHRPELPILFVTGYAENAAIRADFLGTNMAMITKPFAIQDLSAKIREMLG